jgi:general stress protein 26
LEAFVAETKHEDEIRKLAAMIKGIKFAMLTTAGEDGSLHSRPMTTQETEFDGDLWFFTRADAPKAGEAEDKQVNVSFADPAKSTYVSASGSAILVRDQAKIKELWKPAYKIFFPEGLDDPEIALLKVSIHRAEYWDAPGSALGRAFNFARAYVSKDATKLGEHAKVDLS